jgi:hypothetical protein
MPEPAGNRSDGRSEPTPASREEPAGLLAALQAGELTRRLTAMVRHRGSFR